MQQCSLVLLTEKANRTLQETDRYWLPKCHGKPRTNKLISTGHIPRSEHKTVISNNSIPIPKQTQKRRETISRNLLVKENNPEAKGRGPIVRVLIGGERQGMGTDTARRV